MRKKFEKTLAFATALFLLAVCFMPLTTAYAAGVSVSSKTCEVGDTVTVTVKFTQSNIAGVEANFSYDSSILQYTGGSGTGNGKISVYTDQEGVSSLSASIKFKALKTGASTISVTTTGFYEDIAELNPVGNVSGSGKVTVKEEAVSTPRPSTSAAPTPTPLPPIPVTVNGATLYIARDLSAVTLPADFAISEIAYESETIQAAVRSDGKITLFYLTDSGGQNGAFYVFDATESDFYPHISLTNSGTYTVLKLPSSVVVPDGYQQVGLVIGDQTVAAWQQASGQNPAFYLLYVMTPKGETGFCLYDTDEGTIQRYADHSVTLTPTPTPVVQLTLWQTVQGRPALLILFGTLLALCIALSVSLIFVGKKRRSARQKRPLSHDETPEPKE